MKKCKIVTKKSGVNISLANKLVKYIAKLSRKDVKKGMIPLIRKILVALDHYSILVS